MKTKTALILSGIILGLLFAAGIVLYPSLPARLDSHWNAQGVVNGTTSRFWGVFLVPIIGLLLVALFFAIPYIDPRRRNIERFRGIYNSFIVVLVLFLAYLHGLTLAWNLGLRFSFLPWFLPAMALLFWYMGYLLGEAEPNWFIGIRTPWTLSSDMVWRKTHALGSKLFRLTAILTLIGILFPAAAILFLLVPVLATALFLVVYSYVLYRQEERMKKPENKKKKK